MLDSHAGKLGCAMSVVQCGSEAIGYSNNLRRCALELAALAVNHGIIPLRLSS